MYSTLKEPIPEPMRVRRSKGGERQLKPKGGLACIGFILSAFGADGIVSAAEKLRLRCHPSPLVTLVLSLDPARVSAQPRHWPYPVVVLPSGFTITTAKPPRLI